MVYLLSLSQLPIVLIFSYVYARDTHEREPLRLLFYCFVGGIFCFFPALVLELVFQAIVPVSTTLPLVSHGIAMLLGVAFIEEGCKLATLLYLAYRAKDFNEPFDGIIYSVAVSLGLAAIENALYSLQHGIAVAWLRMFSAVPLHAMCAILMGFYVGQAKFVHDRKLSRALIALGLVAATIAHGSYNYFVALDSIAYAPAALFILVVQVLLARRAMRIHNSHPPVHDGKGCVFFPSQERSLILAPADMSVMALNIIASLSLVWAAINFSAPLRESLSIPLETAAAAGILGLATAILTFGASWGIRRRRPGAWRIGLGILVIMLPTPGFILSLIGLFGLLHLETRKLFSSPDNCL